MLAWQNLPCDYLILNHLFPVGFQRHSAQFWFISHKKSKSVAARAKGWDPKDGICQHLACKVCSVGATTTRPSLVEHSTC